ncbi:hypothetical protein NUU61_003382 [Penicillium alfredii]|uniref:Uncharacterized protein n=1 Tax=Penicillium alfredii TaxID=1506179 RepID=A0A9W9KGW1_9EURO|nr:uncharacterized protein NUU61_003382 [Penicillium alfredii]KAJ5106035.1 hypothetical protein NUU61_003382 [Penicillium alfredii]
MAYRKLVGYWLVGRYLRADGPITLPVSASRFYQCGRKGEITFSGINSVCETLCSSWCSTDCNIFGYACDTCQYKSAGAPPDEDHRKLSEWCIPHTWESGSHTRHASLDWYTYDNFKGHRLISCPRGCAYVDTPV